MARLFTFLKRRVRLLLLAAFAAAMFAAWLGLWARILPLKPRASWSMRDNVVLLGFSDDSSALVTQRVASDIVEVWNTVDGSCRSRVVLRGHEPEHVAVANVDFSSDCRYLATHLQEDTSLRLRIVNVALERELATLDVDHDLQSLPSWVRPDHAFRFSPDGKSLAYSVASEAGASKAVIVWDVENCRQRFVLRDHVRRMAFSSDNRLFAAVNSLQPDGYSVTLCDASSGQRFTSLGHYISPPDIEFTSDGESLLVASFHPSNEDSAAFHSLAEIWSLSSFHRTAIYERWQPAGVSCHPWLLSDGKRLCWWLLVHHTAATQHEVVDIRTGRTEWAHHSHAPTDGEPHLDPTGRWLAIRGIVPRPTNLNWATFFRASDSDDASRTMQGVKIVSVPDGDSTFLPVECNESIFSRDGTLVVTNDTNGNLQIWDLPPRRPVFLLLTLAAVPALLFTGVVWWKLVR